MRRMLSIGILLGANLAAAAQTDMPKPAYDFSLPREERIKLAESAEPRDGVFANIPYGKKPKASFKDLTRSDPVG